MLHEGREQLVPDGGDDRNEQDDAFPEQFSVQTRDALKAAVEELVEALHRHAEHVAGLRGGSSEIPSVHEMNRQVEMAIAGWNDRVVEHTGTLPVSLAGFGEDEYEEEEDDGDDEDDEEVVDGSTPVSVVSRFDLLVKDAEALVKAGRDAHKRNRPEEQDEDAAVAVPNFGQALYAVLYERGEPWYDLPGVEVVRGIRAYVQPDEPAEPFTEDEAEVEVPIAEPAGDRWFRESWA